MTGRLLQRALLVAAPAVAWFPLLGLCQELPRRATARLGTLQFRQTGETSSLDFSSDGKLLASTCSNDGCIYLFDAATGRRLRRISVEADGHRRLSALAFSPKGSTLAVASFIGPVHIIDVVTGRTVRQIAVERSHVEYGVQLAFSPDGSMLALADTFEWRVLRVDNGEVLLSDEPRAEIRDLRFSADGRFLIVAGIKPPVAVWDVRLKKRIRTVDVHATSAFSAAFSPDGQTGISSSTDVAVWNPADGKLIRRLKGDDADDLFLRVRIASGGKRIVGASQEGPVYVWNADTGERHAKLAANIWLLCAMAVSADGKRGRRFRRPADPPLEYRERQGVVRGFSGA